MLNRSHLTLGKTGEAIVERYLLIKGYEVVGRNYRKKFGEIDIIASKGSVLYFIEVKSVSGKLRDIESFDGYHLVSRGTFLANREVNISDQDLDVSRETNSGYLPEDNIHSQKVKRLSRTILTYISDHHYEGDWSFSYAIVVMDMKKYVAVVKYIDDVALT